MIRLPRLYPIVDTGLVERRGCSAVMAAEAMLAGGAGILQFRHKGSFRRSIFEQAERVAELCRAAGVPLVVDDRADIALLLDAGLHIGQDDLTPLDARKLIGPQRLLGFSTHNEAQVRAAAGEPVDYVALGPIFATATKENPDTVVGLEELRRLRGLTDRPLTAIGGITTENAASVWEAGADTVAVIGDLYPETCSFHAIRERMEEWQRLVRR